MLNLLRIAMIGLFGMALAGAAPGERAATAPSSQQAQLAELQLLHTELSAQIKLEEQRAEKNDPLWALAQKRQGLLPYQWDRHNAAYEAAEKWYDEHQMVKSVAAREKADSAYMADAVLRMLKDPQDAQLLKDAVMRGPYLKVKKLADQLVREVPDLDRKQLDDPANLWQAISEKLPQAEKNVAADLAAVPQLLGIPASVSEPHRAFDEQYLRSVVYGAYIDVHRPPALERLYDDAAAVQKQMNEIAQSNKPARK